MADDLATFEPEIIQPTASPSAAPITEDIANEFGFTVDAILDRLLTI